MKLPRWMRPVDGRGSQSWLYGDGCAARCGGHVCVIGRHTGQHVSAVGFVWGSPAPIEQVA